MAITTIRTTYALDTQTVKTLEQISRRWGVSKSEALRRAIRGAARQPAPQSDALEALTQLQQALGLSGTAAGAWQRRARRERRASSTRMEKRGA